MLPPAFVVEEEGPSQKSTLPAPRPVTQSFGLRQFIVNIHVRGPAVWRGLLPRLTSVDLFNIMRLF